VPAALASWGVTRGARRMGTMPRTEAGAESCGPRSRTWIGCCTDASWYPCTAPCSCSCRRAGRARCGHPGRPRPAGAAAQHGDTPAIPAGFRERRPQPPLTRLSISSPRFLSPRATGMAGGMAGEAAVKERGPALPPRLLVYSNVGAWLLLLLVNGLSGLGVFGDDNGGCGDDRALRQAAGTPAAAWTWRIAHPLACRHDRSAPATPRPPSRPPSHAGTISARHPTPITPSGWAFSIWGIIFLLQGAGVIYAALPADNAVPWKRQAINTIGGCSWSTMP